MVLSVQTPQTQPSFPIDSSDVMKDRLILFLEAAMSSHQCFGLLLSPRCLKSWAHNVLQGNLLSESAGEMARCAGCARCPNDGALWPFADILLNFHWVGWCSLTVFPLICTEEFFQENTTFVLILVWYLSIFSVWWGIRATHTWFYTINSLDCWSSLS